MSSNQISSSINLSRNTNQSNLNQLNKGQNISTLKSYNKSRTESDFKSAKSLNAMRLPSALQKKESHPLGLEFELWQIANCTIHKQYKRAKFKFILKAKSSIRKLPIQYKWK